RREGEGFEADAPEIVADDGGQRDRATTNRPRRAREHETMLIGRELELTILQRALVKSEQERGQVLILIGEAGIGKTSLVTALAAEAERRGSRVLVGRCHESEQILPFGPWIDAFRTGEVTVDKQLLASLSPVTRAELTRLFPEMGSPGLPTPSDDRRQLFDS